MAKMIPQDFSSTDFHCSYGEVQVYNALKNLPDDFTVFHSIHWNRKTEFGTVQWGECDFTVLHPKRGIVVIEVKSGGIRHVNGKWTQTNSISGEVHLMKDPMVQAERSKFEFIELLDNGDDRYNKYWVEAAVWFPSVEERITSGELPPSYKPGNVLTKRDLLAPMRSISRVYDLYNMRVRPWFKPEDTANAIRILSPAYNAILSIAGKIEIQEFYFYRMTKEQGFLLDYLDDQREAVIQGGAGTGKTVIALEKAQRLSVTGKTLFLCFNRYLLDYIRETKSASMPDVDFYNLIGLTMQKMRLTELADTSAVTDYLNRYDEFFWPYKHIVIDEGQDFSTEHLQLLRVIAEITNGSLYIFYDKNQLVHLKGGLEWFNTFECRLLLNTNCRNTLNIAKASNAPLGINNIKTRINLEGRIPNLYIARNDDSALNALSNLIRTYTDGGIQKKQIVILTAKTESTSILSGMYSIGRYSLASDRNTSGIFFTSARKFKGLESDVVILIDIDEDSFDIAESRRIIYVGASRAKHYLDFLLMASNSGLAKISKAITENIESDSKDDKQQIARILNVKVVMCTS